MPSLRTAFTAGLAVAVAVLLPACVHGQDSDSSGSSSSQGPPGCMAKPTFTGFPIGGNVSNKEPFEVKVMWKVENCPPGLMATNGTVVMRNDTTLFRRNTTHLKLPPFTLRFGRHTAGAEYRLHHPNGTTAFVFRHGETFYVVGKPCMAHAMFMGLPESGNLSTAHPLNVRVMWKVEHCHPNLTIGPNRTVVMQNDVFLHQNNNSFIRLDAGVLSVGKYTVGAELLLLTPNGSTAHTFQHGKDLFITEPVCTAMAKFMGIKFVKRGEPPQVLSLFDPVKFAVEWIIIDCPRLVQARRVAVIQDDVIQAEFPGTQLFLPRGNLLPGQYTAGAELTLFLANGTQAFQFRHGTQFIIGAPRCTGLSLSLPPTLSIPNDNRAFFIRPELNTSMCRDVPVEIEFSVVDPTTQQVVASPGGRVMEIDATQFSAGESYLVTAKAFAFVGNRTVMATSNVLRVTFTEGSGSGAGQPPPCDNFLELDGLPDSVRQRRDRELRLGAAVRSGCPLSRRARVAGTWRLYNGTVLIAAVNRMIFVARPKELPAGSYVLALTVVVTDGSREVMLTRNVTVDISEEPAQLRILGGNRTVGTSGVLDFLADGTNIEGFEVLWGICLPDLTRAGLNCASAVNVEGITGRRGWAVFVDAPSTAGSWVLWATARGERAAILVTVTSGPVLDVAIFGIPLRPLGGGRPLPLFAHSDDATAYAWYINNGASPLAGRTGPQVLLTATEVATAAAANGGKVTVRVVARNAAGTTGEAQGEFKVLKPKQGRCTVSGAKGFGKLTGGETTMTIGAADFADTGVEVLYAFGYTIGSGANARDFILNDDFASQASFNFTAPLLPGRAAGSVKVRFFVEAIPAETADDFNTVPVIAECNALIHRNTKISGNVSAYAELADAELGLAEEAGDLGSVLRAMAGVTSMFGEFTLPGDDSGSGATAPTAADKARAATMRKSSLGSLRRTFTKVGGKMTNSQRGQVLSTMASFFTDDEDAEDDLLDDVSELLGGVLGDAETGGLDMAKLGASVVKMLLKVPDRASGNTSRRALSQKAALATATGLQVGQEQEVRSGTLTLRATKLPIDAMAKKNITAGTKQVNVPRAAFGSANLSKSTEVAVSTVDYQTVPMPNATGASLVNNGSAVEIDVVVNNKQRPVSGLNATDAVRIGVTATGIVGAAKCVFFNLITAAWSDEGVTTVVVAGVVQCRSTHLSLFAVQDTAQSTTPAPPPSSSASAVSAAVAVAVAGLVALFA